jgi:hypothetical protein
MKHPLRLLLIAPLTLGLVACDEYPSDWPAVDKPLFNACPNIQGTYALTTPSGGNVAPVLHQSPPFRSLFAQNPGRWPWESMTIEGDINTGFSVTLARSPQTLDAWREYFFAQGGKNYYRNQYNTMHAAQTRWRGSFAQMSDDEYAANLAELFIAATRRYELKRGTDYECSHGWIKSERWKHDPGPDRSRPEPDQLDGHMRFGQDHAGNLVVESIFQQAEQLNIWCGDGCKGIPLGTWTQHRWTQLKRTMPAHDGKLPRPWADTFVIEYPHLLDSSAKSEQLAKLREKIMPLLAKGVRLSALQVTQGGLGYEGVRATLLSADSGALRQTLKNLAQAHINLNKQGVNGEQNVEALQKTPAGDYELWLWLSMAYVLTEANRAPNQHEVIVSESLKRLPAGMKITGSARYAPGADIYITSPDEASIAQFLRAMTQDGVYATEVLHSRYETARQEYSARILIKVR